MNLLATLVRRIHGMLGTLKIRHVPIPGPLIPALLSAALLLGIVQPAQAGLVRYTVSGAFDTGTLAGMRYVETFTFDESGRPAVLGSTPWITPLLDFRLEVESQTKVWSLADWPLEHSFSMWVDAGGFTHSRAYVATSGPFGSPPAFAEFHDDGAPHSRTHHVKWYDWSVWNTLQTDSLDNDALALIVQVPEPGSLALSLLALLLALLLVGGKRAARRRDDPPAGRGQAARQDQALGDGKAG